jgi:hypothetical protein
MPFTDDDLRELLHRLRTDPEARREIYEIVHAPALEGIQTELRGLAAAQRRTDERLAALAGEMQALTARVDQLTAQMQALGERVEQLAKTISRLGDRVGGLQGESLEKRYRERAGAYFGTVLRKTRVVEAGALEEALEQKLSAQEMHDTLLTDVIVSGKPRSRPEVEEVWLAIEVSSVVDREDVHRAIRRSLLLRRSGHPAIPAVAGERIDPPARNIAQEARVAVFEDGKVSNWDEALGAALGAA